MRRRRGVVGAVVASVLLSWTLAAGPAVADEAVAPGAPEVSSDAVPTEPEADGAAAERDEAGAETPAAPTAQDPAAGALDAEEPDAATADDAAAPLGGELGAAAAGESQDAVGTPGPTASSTEHDGPPEAGGTSTPDPEPAEDEGSRADGGGGASGSSSEDGASAAPEALAVADLGIVDVRWECDVTGSGRLFVTVANTGDQDHDIILATSTAETFETAPASSTTEFGFWAEPGQETVVLREYWTTELLDARDVRLVECLSVTSDCERITLTNPAGNPVVDLTWRVLVSGEENSRRLGPGESVEVDDERISWRAHSVDDPDVSAGQEEDRRAVRCTSEPVFVGATCTPAGRSAGAVTATVAAAEDAGAHLSVLDARGRVLRSLPVPQGRYGQVEATGLAPGRYEVRVTAGTTTSVPVHVYECADVSTSCAAVTVTNPAGNPAVRGDVLEVHSSESVAELALEPGETVTVPVATASNLVRVVFEMPGAEEYFPFGAAVSARVEVAPACEQPPTEPEEPGEEPPVEEPPVDEEPVEEEPAGGGPGAVDEEPASGDDDTDGGSAPEDAEEQGEAVAVEVRTPAATWDGGRATGDRRGLADTGGPALPLALVGLLLVGCGVRLVARRS